jgi:hypothetical protein
MTEDSRAVAARAGAAELADIIAGEGRAGQVWQQRIRQIAAELGADGSLRAARERFDSLYAGGRNFSDFHIWRTDEAERIAANERLSTLVGRLRTLLEP